MTHRTSIENAYYTHDHDMFHKELKKLTTAQARVGRLYSLSEALRASVSSAPSLEMVRRHVATFTQEVRRVLETDE